MIIKKYELPPDFPVLKNVDQVKKKLAEIPARKPLPPKVEEKIEKVDMPPKSIVEKPLSRKPSEGGAKKTQITIRLPVEVIAFFRATGRDWQPRLGEVLLAYVRAQKRTDIGG